MTINYVTLVLDLYDGQRNPVTKGAAALVPSAQLTDTVNGGITTQAPVPGVFHPGGFPMVKLEATDNTGPEPAFAWTVSFDGVPGSPPGFSFYLPYTGGATQYLSALTPVSAPSTLLGSTAAGVSVYPSGDTSGVIDQANITAAEALGRTVYLAPGTFTVTGLTKQAGTIWQGAGRLETIIQLASGSNTDVIQGAGFTSLTLGGDTDPGGIGGWGIRDLSIDGNGTNQAGTSYGLRFYGYNFDLSNVSIRNCLSWGMYSEWGSFGNPGADSAMEARCYGLKIHGNGQGGWHNRGPHDSRTFDVTIFDNGTGFPAYWCEDATTEYPVTSGSNGADLAAFTSDSPGTLHVSSTLGYPSASISASQGSITVPTAHSPVVLTYTGTTGTTYTGCVAQGSPASGSTVSTGAAVSMTGGGYTADGSYHFGMHNYGRAADWQYMVDATQYLIGCVAEQGSAGMVLMRGADSVLGDMSLYVNGTQEGCGLQLGDSVNPAYNVMARVSVASLANSGAGSASLVITNDAGNNDVELTVLALSGSTVVSGTADPRSRYRVTAQGQILSANLANSFWQEPLALNAQALDAPAATVSGIMSAGQFESITPGTGTGNEAHGVSALASNTTGADNAAIGDYALSANTQGGSNVAAGIYALLANTTGSNNVAVGNSALAANIGGSTSVAVGAYALAGQTTGSSNVAVGAYALQGTTTGANNIAVGNSVLAGCITGSGNVGVGAYTLGATTAGGNTALGTYALQANTTGSNNVAVGSGAQASGTGNSYVTAIGAGTQVTASGAVAIGADHSGGAASASVQDQFVLGTPNHQIQILNNTTGSGSALLGANCPAVTATAPYKWFKMMSSDGSTVYVPAWK